ncbi:prolyl oligopeptidase family serine peptidase [Bacillaceae bacterium SIJ1]|nr:prolyl oligopeptidase family serine peptidase [Litoribacterium kuwaitense]
MQFEHKHSQPSHQDVQSIAYLLSMPDQKTIEQGRYPLVLFLHGSGERGSDVKKVEEQGLPKIMTAWHERPFMMIAPQCKEGTDWSQWLDTVIALLDEIVDKYPIDEDRIYVTGLSMGGYGSWALSAMAPARFAAVIPICGGGDIAHASALTSIPIWAFHGAKDDIVPLDRSEAMVEAVQQAGGNATLTIYPDAMHDSWTETYTNADVIQWMLAQKRPSSRR